MHAIPTNVLTPDPDAIGAPDLDLLDTADDESRPLPERVPWSITSLQAAEWALSRYLMAAQVVARNGEAAAEWMAQIDAWLARANAPHERRLAFLRHHLSEWAITQRLADKKAPAAVQLPSGFIRTQKSAQRITWAAGVDGSHDAAVAWATEHGVTVKYTVTAVAQTGEVPVEVMDAVKVLEAHGFHVDVVGKVALATLTAAQRADTPGACLGVAEIRDENDLDHVEKRVVDTETGEVIPWLQVVPEDVNVTEIGPYATGGAMGGGNPVVGLR